MERYLEDFDDLTVALERLRDPTDPVHWTGIRSSMRGYSVRIERSAIKRLHIVQRLGQGTVLCTARIPQR